MNAMIGLLTLALLGSGSTLPRFSVNEPRDAYEYLLSMPRPSQFSKIIGRNGHWESVDRQLLPNLNNCIEAISRLSIEQQTSAEIKLIAASGKYPSDKRFDIAKLDFLRLWQGEKTILHDDYYISFLRMSIYGLAYTDGFSVVPWVTGNDYSFRRDNTDLALISAKKGAFVVNSLAALKGEILLRSMPQQVDFMEMMLTSDGAVLAHPEKLSHLNSLLKQFEKLSRADQMRAELEYIARCKELGSATSEFDLGKLDFLRKWMTKSPIIHHANYLSFLRMTPHALVFSADTPPIPYDDDSTFSFSRFEIAAKAAKTGEFVLIPPGPHLGP